MNLKSFEHLVRDLSNMFGLDLTRYRPENSETGRLASMLSFHEIDFFLNLICDGGLESDNQKHPREL